MSSIKRSIDEASSVGLADYEDWMSTSIYVWYGAGLLILVICIVAPNFFLTPKQKAD